MNSTQSQGSGPPTYGIGSRQLFTLVYIFPMWQKGKGWLPQRKRRPVLDPRFA